MQLPVEVSGKNTSTAAQSVEMLDLNVGLSPPESRRL